jgi:hypothetical protein
MSFCDWTWYRFLNQDLICMKATYLTKEHLATTTRCKVPLHFEALLTDVRCTPVLCRYKNGTKPTSIMRDFNQLSQPFWKMKFLNT